MVQYCTRSALKISEARGWTRERRTAVLNATEVLLCPLLGSPYKIVAATPGFYSIDREDATKVQQGLPVSSTSRSPTTTS